MVRWRVYVREIALLGTKPKCLIQYLIGQNYKLDPKIWLLIGYISIKAISCGSQCASLFFLINMIIDLEILRFWIQNLTFNFLSKSGHIIHVCDKCMRKTVLLVWSLSKYTCFCSMESLTFAVPLFLLLSSVSLHCFSPHHIGMIDQVFNVWKDVQYDWPIKSSRPYGLLHLYAQYGQVELSHFFLNYSNCFSVRSQDLVSTRCKTNQIWQLV